MLVGIKYVTWLMSREVGQGCGRIFAAILLVPQLFGHRIRLIYAHGVAIKKRALSTKEKPTLKRAACPKHRSSSCDLKHGRLHVACGASADLRSEPAVWNFRCL